MNEKRKKKYIADFQNVAFHTDTGITSAKYSFKYNAHNFGICVSVLSYSIVSKLFESKTPFLIVAYAQNASFEWYIVKLRKKTTKKTHHDCVFLFDKLCLSHLHTSTAVSLFHRSPLHSIHNSSIL